MRPVVPIVPEPWLIRSPEKEVESASGAFEGIAHRIENYRR